MPDFDYFVVFADRRTGSNFLEANINAIDGLTCHGEAFNPTFIGLPSRPKMLGVSLGDRNADPMELLRRIKTADGLNGFRYFNGHDPRVFDTIVADPRCAKIILTRNPLDSFVSLEIARTTQQWKLTDPSRRKSEPITFDPISFERHMGDLQAFQLRLVNGLQKSAQLAFFIGYEDLQNVEAINDLADFLGCEDRLAGLDTSVKKQNPAKMSDKVLNYDEMMDALGGLGSIDLAIPPETEPRRGASVHTYLATPDSALMYQILRSGPTSAVADWMAELDGVRYHGLLKNFTPNTLLRWKADRPGHRCFTVVRHPVARTHAAFCDKILSTGSGSYPEIRKVLSRTYALNLPEKTPDSSYNSPAHRAAFLAFLRFLKLNLSGQTAVRIDPHWATQANTVQGFADFAAPDSILREDQLEDGLAVLAAQIGKSTMPQVREPTDPHRDKLLEIYDAEVEAAVHDVYRRDYVMFGFGSYA